MQLTACWVIRITQKVSVGEKKKKDNIASGNK